MLNAINPIILQLKSKKKVIYNSLWVIVDKVIRMVGGLVVGIWFARFLGPYNFGAWNYAYSIVSLAIPFINLGLNNILLTDLIVSADKGKILFTGLVIKIASGAVMGLLVCAFSFTLQNEQLTRTLLMILSIQCLFQCSDVFDTFYQSRTESKNSVFAKTSAYVVINVVKVVALMNGFSLLFFCYLTVMEIIIATIILVFFYFQVSGQQIADWKFDMNLVKSLLRRSWPLIIAELLITMYTRLDQIMLKNMVGNIELGRYSAAVRLSEIWYFVAGAISVSLYPSIMKLKEKSEEQFLNGFQKLFNLLTSISFGLALFFSLFANIITGILFGSKYPGIGIILSIHIWTGVFVYLGVGCGNWFIAKNLQRYMIIRTATGAVINAALNLILIPRYHAAGAAFATLVAQAFASVISNAFSKETRVIFWMQLKSFAALVKPSLSNYF